MRRSQKRQLSVTEPAQWKADPFGLGLDCLALIFSFVDNSIQQWQLQRQVCWSWSTWSMHSRRLGLLSDVVGNIQNMPHISRLVGLQNLLMEGCLEHVMQSMASMAANLTSLKHLVLDSTGIDILGMQYLSVLTGLKSLSLRDCEHIDDESLVSLLCFPDLEDLGLGGSSRVSDEGVIRNICCLSNLTNLDLSRCEVTDMSITRVCCSLPKLERLEIGQTRIKDESLKSSENLKALVYLDLQECQISGEGLQNLTKLTQLQFLTIDVTVHLCIDFVASLTNLTTLRIQNVSVAQDMSGLSKLTKLSSLMLTDTGVYPIHLKTISCFPLLRQLSFLFCTFMDDESLGLLSSLQHLSTLNLCYCDEVTNLSSVSLLCSLRFLSLTGCSSVRDEAITALSTLTFLQILLEDCPQITDASRKYEKPGPISL